MKLVECKAYLISSFHTDGVVMIVSNGMGMNPVW